MTIIPFRWQRVGSGMNDRSSFCEYVEAGYCTLPNWLQAWLDMSQNIQNTVFCMILCLMSGKHVDLGWGFVGFRLIQFRARSEGSHVPYTLSSAKRKADGGFIELLWVYSIQMYTVQLCTHHCTHIMADSHDFSIFIHIMWEYVGVQTKTTTKLRASDGTEAIDPHLASDDEFDNMLSMAIRLMNVNEC